MKPITFDSEAESEFQAAASYYEGPQVSAAPFSLHTLFLGTTRSDLGRGRGASTAPSRLLVASTAVRVHQPG